MTHASTSEEKGDGEAARDEKVVEEAEREWDEDEDDDEDEDTVEDEEGGRRLSMV